MSEDRRMKAAERLGRKADREFTRANYEDLPAASWTFEEGLHHVACTFELACRQWPDLMEPFVVLLESADDDRQRKQIMQRGLRETVNERYGVSA